jgi:hypothetical protein
LIDQREWRGSNDGFVRGPGNPTERAGEIDFREGGEIESELTVRTTLTNVHPRTPREMAIGWAEKERKAIEAGQ